MARRCAITEKGGLSGNTVSHSNRKAKRRFLPNMQQVSLQSEALNQTISMRITASTLRTIDHNGGLDNYLVTTHSKSLSEGARMLKKRVLKARENAAASAASVAV